MKHRLFRVERWELRVGEVEGEETGDEGPAVAEILNAEQCPSYHDDEKGQGNFDELKIEN